MSSLVFGLGLAVLASVALNASYLLQHAGSRSAPDIDVRRPVVTARGLLRSRWWVAGLAAGLGGWALHVGALASAPLSLVQAFAAGGLALTVPVAARAFGERLAARERGAIGLMVASLALLGIGATGAGAATVPVTAMLIYLAVAAAAAGGLVLVAGGARRAVALGAVGGILYGAGDAATKALTLSAHGVGGLLTSPWTLVVAAFSAGAFLCFQRGLQIGPAVPVIALMTAATNAVAVLGGLLVFGEPLGATPILAATHLAAFLLAGGAGLLLARAQTRLRPPGHPPGDDPQPESRRCGQVVAGSVVAEPAR